MFHLFKQLLFSAPLILMLWIPFPETVCAQGFSVEEGVGEKELLRMGNYRGALKAYLTLLETDKNNHKYKHFIGQCYLNMDDDKSQSIPYLEAAWKQDQSNPEVLADLARAYHFTMKFDKAIKLFNDYKEITADPQDIINAERQIEMCNNGKELIKYPLKIVFENLGKKVNSPYPDFTPCVPNDESYMVFTSRRKGNKGNLLDYDGYYTSDMYMSRVKNGEFGKAANVGNVNSESDEEVAGISPIGDKVLVFVDDVFQNIFANIYITEKKGRSLRSLESVSGSVNTPTTMETSGAITTNGQLLYFASNIKGGFGGMDLYVCKKMPDGSWGEAFNLGPDINTQYNEEYPSVSYDGETLYFSSQGHTSMGGYDIFVSKRDLENDKWARPYNIGYPLNNAEDNMSISFSARWHMGSETENNKYAYISAYRKGGFGDLDIYRITFTDIENQLTAIRGHIRKKVLIDYSVHKTVHSYSKDGKTIIIPEELHPWYDKSWGLEDSKEILVEPGYDYKTMLYFTKDGVQKAFTTKKYPKDDPEWSFVKIRSAQVKKKDYAPPQTLYEERPLPETKIYVTNVSSGDRFKYVPTKKGNYVIILPPGKYELLIEPEDYEPKKVVLNIYDKGSYEAEITKDYMFGSDD